MSEKPSDQNDGAVTDRHLKLKAKSADRLRQNLLKRKMQMREREKSLPTEEGK